MTVKRLAKIMAKRFQEYPGITFEPGACGVYVDILGTTIGVPFHREDPVDTAVLRFYHDSMEKIEWGKNCPGYVYGVLLNELRRSLGIRVGMKLKYLKSRLKGIAKITFRNEESDILVESGISSSVIPVRKVTELLLEDDNALASTILTRVVSHLCKTNGIVGDLMEEYRDA